MRPKLGDVNPNVRYVKYETGSAFRRAGAFLPRKIIKRNTYEYRLSPYMGCPKRCQYCFELHNEFIHIDEVKIKTNTVSLLKKTLPNLHKIKPILLDGYDCEVAEQKEGLIRSSLEIIVEYSLPLFIQTKSDLVLRDLDLLKELNDLGSFVNVSFSLTDLNREHTKIFEPYTCSPTNRLKALKRISDAGIQTGIILMPILPFISDEDEELEILFSKAVENGAQYIVPESLRLKGEGGQRKMWFDVLRKHYPSLVARYEKLYPATGFGLKFGSFPNDIGYSGGLSKKIMKLSKDYGVSTDFPNVPQAKVEKSPIVSRYQNRLDSFM